MVELSAMIESADGSSALPVPAFPPRIPNVLDARPIAAVDF